MAKKQSKQTINTDQLKKQRKKCKFFFLLNVVLEALAIGAVIFCLISSNCVLGNEVGGAVFIYLIFIFSAFIPDLVYLMLSRKLHTLGIDPLGVMFNFLIGILCILIGISLIFVLLSFCGNYAQLILVAAGVLSVCSGMLHLMNAFMCHKRLPKSERYYRTSRRRKVSMADKKKANQDRKGDKKSATKKDAKKRDAKANAKKGGKEVNKKGAKSKASPAGKKSAGKKGVK
ncbi:uncharacterized protein [Eurosta solidaginis]|uniref:uncharacterized protein n=1 Tax=Eurosta solidaginis TaxID=178769 RepID=UPI003531792C